jgi:hypothetical protein
MADADAPHGALYVAYDRASEPRTLALRLDQDGFGLQRFDYGFAGYEDGGGTFGYAIRNERGDLLFVEAGFEPGGAGAAEVSFIAAGGLTGSFRQCWDGAACLVYVDDPLNYSCGGPGCSTGDRAACPTLHASPFPF